MHEFFFPALLPHLLGAYTQSIECPMILLHHIFYFPLCLVDFAPFLFFFFFF